VSPRRGAVTAPRKDADARSGDDRRWRLEDQRDFLVRSLADLRSEFAAGDLEARDYEALLARDEGRLSAVEDELRGLDAEESETDAAAAGPGHPDPDEAKRATRRRRPLLAVIATVALTAGATLLVIHLASPRLPGQPETGSAPQNLAKEVLTQLAEASILVEEGTSTSLDQALTVYRTVLVEDPTQPQALAETGWLEWEAGFSGGNTKLQRSGTALVARSIKVEPSDYAAHLFMGTIDLKGDHDAAAAVAQYKAFLSDHPPKAQITTAAPLIRQAFSEAGRPVPASVG
jgi:hypothetical protein